MSLLDNDQYKFTMMQAAFHLFPTAEAEYELRIRSMVDLRPFKKQIQERIEEWCAQRFEQEEIAYLSSIRFMKPDFVGYLEDYRPKMRYIHVGEKNGQLSLRIRGPWSATILFEVPILAIIEEVYCAQDVIQTSGSVPVDTMTPERLEYGLKRLKMKIDVAKKEGFRFIDFGTRRRYSRAWHEHVVKTLAAALPPEIFAGTSNLYLAKKYNLTPQGTMAHEWLQAGQGLGHCQLINSQKFMLEKWAEEYRGDLGIALTDTIGMDAFLRDFDMYLAKLYDGGRQDSGDPYAWGEKFIAHLKSLNIDPLTKIGVWSNDLTFGIDPGIHRDRNMVEINRHFNGRIKRTFGVGTNLTNDVGVRPLSIVIKLVRMNGNPVAKISDDPVKAVCEDELFLKYLKDINGVK